MFSIYNILTIAKYETKTLLRSWFFRIFAILALVILGFIDFAGLAGVAGSPWSIRGMSSIIPYATVALLTIAQAILAVFLSSDFIKRDKKLDTSEVLFARPMSNGDYVFGKTLGNLYLFLGMTLIGFVIALIANYVSAGVSIDIKLYLYYLLIISIPTLIFVFGLSYVLMIFTKNLAITYMLMLAYLASSLFFIKDNYNYWFDFMCFYYPLNFSDFTGFANFTDILIQRGFYLATGLGFIFLTIYKIDRLFQSGLLKSFSFIVFLICITTAGLLTSTHIRNTNTYDLVREEYISLNNTYSKYPTANILSNNLEIEHSENTINVTSGLLLKNNNDNKLNKLIFHLNPSLKINSVTSNGNDVKFSRNKQIIEINSEIDKGDTKNIQIKYSGTIDESYMYLDIEKEKLHKYEELFIVKNATEFSYITPNYILLTNEAAWYPVSGTSFSSNNPAWYKTDFTNFTLKVKKQKNLVAISQGKKSKVSDSEVQFNNEHPLPEISLVIGNYSEKSIVVDSINYKLLTLKGHDFFSKPLKSIKDTLPSLIRELQSDFERKINMKYPFKSFSVIETPVHYKVVKRLWTNTTEAVQPQMAFLPEKGITIRQADFKRYKERMKRRSQRRNEEATDMEVEIDLFNSFVNQVFLRTETGDFRRMRNNQNDTKNYYNLFPTYFTCSNYIVSDKWPMFNSIIELYMQEQMNSDIPSYFKRFRGLSVSEKANLELLDKSFSDLFASDIDNDIMAEVINLKGKYLLSIIKSKVGDENFSNFVYEFIDRNKYKAASFKDFSRQLKKEFKFDILPYMNEWYNSNKLPSFIFSSINTKRVKVEGEVYFAIQFKVQNKSDIDGIVTMTVNKGGGRRRRGGGGGDNIALYKVLSVDANTTKSYTITVDDKPGRISFNTLTSRNIPSEVAMRIKDIQKVKGYDIDDSETVVGEDAIIIDKNTVIVDNEDENFEVINVSKQSYLKKLINKFKAKDKTKYISEFYWPSVWKPAVGSDYYGNHIKSAHRVRKGNGEQKVRWNVKIPSNGEYAVYSYFSDSNNFHFRRRRGGKKKDERIEYNYTIFSDDGKNDVTEDMTSAEDNWVYLGTYYFSKGEAKVELSNKSNKYLVNADAIKLVKSDD